MLGKKRGQSCSVTSLCFLYARAQRWPRQLLPRKENGAEQGCTGPLRFPKRNFQFHFEVCRPVLLNSRFSHMFCMFKGFTPKTATRSNSVRKQTLAWFCPSEDPVPLFLSCSCDALFLKPPCLPAQESGRYSLTRTLLPSETGLTDISCLHFDLVLVLPSIEPQSRSWWGRRPSQRFDEKHCAGSLRCGGTLCCGPRGVNLFGRLSFY